MTAEQKLELPEEVEDVLEELRAVLPDTPRAEAIYERVKRMLAPQCLVTLQEAADFLGIRSEDVALAVLRAEKVPTTWAREQLCVARGGLERVRDSELVLKIQASDRMWDEVDEAFGTEGLTQAEMDALSSTRPGTLPWKRPK